MPVVMNKIVIRRVKEMANEQGLKIMKFFDRKHNTLTVNDLLEEVRGQTGLQNENEFIDTNKNAHAAYLPSSDPEEDDDVSVGLLIEEIIDSEDVADLLDDSGQHQGYQMEVYY